MTTQKKSRRGGEGSSQERMVRFVVIGCGRIAQSHLEALSKIPDAEVSAIVEPREAAGRAVSEEIKCRLFADHRDADLPGLADAALICAPPSSHHEIARHCLDAGLHVLCEKPLTIRAADAEDLVARSADAQRVLMMASKFRYVDDVIKAKALVESGILGNIVLYENSFCSKVLMHDRWNSKKDLGGGGVLIDNGSHSVDIARYLLGPIAEVQVQNGLPAQALEVEDTARLQFRTERGVIGHVDLSWTINKESDFYISIFGSQGTLLVGWKGSRYRQDGNSNWIPFGTGYNKLSAFRSQLENFIGCIRGSQQPLIAPEDALASVKVIEAAYLSASKNHWLRVEAAA